MAVGVVSVALCTHNGERFIEDQLLSILAQSQPPIEIVLSDDASTDATVELARNTVKSYLDGHPDCITRLRVTENPEALGVVRNFEQAILACGSELVALSDQDDVWAVDKLERAAAVFAGRPNLLLLHTDARLIDEAGDALPGSLLAALEVSEQVQHEIHNGLAFELLMRRNLVTGATVIIRRRLAEIAVPFPASWVHDEWLALLAATMGEIDLVPEPLIDYRQHGANQIGVRKLSFFGKFRRLFEPGVERNARLLERALVLVMRFTEMGDEVETERLEVAKRGVLHEQARSALKPGHVGRIVPVIRELQTGRYSEFGRGIFDAVRDLLQPLNRAR